MRTKGNCTRVLLICDLEPRSSIDDIVDVCERHLSLHNCRLAYHWLEDFDRQVTDNHVESR